MLQFRRQTRHPRRRSASHAANAKMMEQRQARAVAGGKLSRVDLQAGNLFAAQILLQTLPRRRGRCGIQFAAQRQPRGRRAAGRERVPMNRQEVDCIVGGHLTVRSFVFVLPTAAQRFVERDHGQ